MIDTDRNLKELLRELVDARKRWNDIIVQHLITDRYAQGATLRSPKKTLYLVGYGEWWREIQAEMDAIKKKIAQSGYTGAKRPRTLWMPTVIERARKITLKIYPARSVRTVSRDEAVKFSKKARKSEKLDEGQNNQYEIVSITGRNYRLKITRKTEKIYLPFSEWAVCLCRGGKIPILKKTRREFFDVKELQKNALCSYRHSSLFIKKPWAPESDSEFETIDDDNSKWNK